MDRRAALYHDATVAATWGLVVNLALGITKAVGGAVGSSFALISDSVNSLGDALTSTAVIIALRIAQRPPDEEHPYGHSRAEGVIASNVALMVMVVALMIGWEALNRLGQATEAPSVWTLWIAGVNAVLKEGLYHYKRVVARRTGSVALLANAWDHRSDALCAVSVLVGIALVRWGGAGFRDADAWASLVVVAFILVASGVLFRRTLHALLDAQAEPTVVTAIREAAAAVDGVGAVDELWVRTSGLEHFVDIHVQVVATIPVSQCHVIAHRVKDHLLAKFPTVRDVLVHLEPHGTAPEDASAGADEVSGVGSDGRRV